MHRLLVGDTVKVVAGAHKGAQGKVRSIDRARGRVVVEGVNLVKRNVKPTQGRAGSVVEVEASIHESNVMPVDPETGRPTRVRIQTREEKKVRVAKSGAVIVAEK